MKEDLILPKNFSLTEYLNMGSRSVMPQQDRGLLIRDFEKLSLTEQQRNLSVLFSLQPYREVYGKPIFITCGYRSRRHELTRNRSGNSYHLTGAIDITSDSLDELDQLLKPSWYGGYKYYKSRNFIHLDLGPNRTW